jgi:hypothetical protein
MTTVPISPGKDGVASVTVAAADPAYGDVIVVYSPVTDAFCPGTWTTTVPISPGKEGVAKVTVEATDPE